MTIRKLVKLHYTYLLNEQVQTILKQTIAEAVNTDIPEVLLYKTIAIRNILFYFKIFCCDQDKNFTIVWAYNSFHTGKI